MAGPAMAEEPGAQVLRERRIVLARAPADHPATIYGAADKPLLLLFDVPLGKGAIRAPGVAVRRHPLSDNTLVLIPSRPLAAARSSIPVVVPLPGGAVTLTLAFKPEALDRRVVIFRSWESASAGRSWTPRGAQSWPPGPLMPVVAAASTGHASSPPRIEMVISNPGEMAVPDAATKCRFSFVVRTKDAPEGYAVEIRSADRAFCESRSH